MWMGVEQASFEQLVSPPRRQFRIPHMGNNRRLVVVDVGNGIGCGLTFVFYGLTWSCERAGDKLKWAVGKGLSQVLGKLNLRDTEHWWDGCDPL